MSGHAHGPASLPTEGLVVPRFVGVPTFMRLPLVASADGLDAAVLGLPSDSGSPFRTGAEDGTGRHRTGTCRQVTSMFSRLIFGFTVCHLPHRRDCGTGIVLQYRAVSRLEDHP